MSLIKKKRRKEPPASPLSAQRFISCQPESQPDATGFSGAEPDATKANPSGFAQDFVAEHSSSV